MTLPSSSSTTVPYITKLKLNTANVFAIFTARLARPSCSKLNTEYQSSGGAGNSDLELRPKNNRGRLAPNLFPITGKRWVRDACE